MRSRTLIMAVTTIATVLGVELTMAARWTTSRHVDPIIVERAQRYIDAVLARDLGSLMGFYRSDTIEMPPARGPVEGRAAIEGMYTSLFAGPARVTAFTQNHLESAIAGDVAYDVGTYTRTVTAPGAPAPIDEQGKFVAILKRTEGDWRVAYLIYNSNHSQSLSPCGGATESSH
jgi:ketosteroid isomerase-like protein